MTAGEFDTQPAMYAWATPLPTATPRLLGAEPLLAAPASDEWFIKTADATCRPDWCEVAARYDNWGPTGLTAGLVQIGAHNPYAPSRGEFRVIVVDPKTGGSLFVNPPLSKPPVGGSLVSRTGWGHDQLDHLSIKISVGAHSEAIFVLARTLTSIRAFQSVGSAAAWQDAGVTAFLADEGTVKDSDGDGVNEIILRNSDGRPTHAQGTPIEETFRWSGDTYALETCRRIPRDAPPTTFRPVNGRCSAANVATADSRTSPAMLASP